MKQRSIKWMKLVAACAGLGLSFAAGVASAVDSKLDDAQASITKAVGLLKEAQGQGAQFEEHRKKAVDLLTRAQGEVVKAKSN